jgi:ubiquinol-cytochrome c reductase cytochrome b subunit
LAGSTNPLYTIGYLDTIKFFPYFYIKDLFAFCSVFFLFLIVVFLYPDTLGHPDNYIPANIFITPKHIVPEWYFLPFFAILRAIPNKLFGILAMFFSIAIIFILPKIDVICHITSPVFRPLFEYMFAIFVVSFLLLGFVGTRPPIYPYLELSQICTLVYFFSCLFCFCFLSRFELYLFKQSTK